MQTTHHVYLVPGFFGFTNLGKLKYFAHVREFLVRYCAERGIRARVHVAKIPPTASLPKRAACVLATIAASSRHDSDAVHLIGHSSGGVDIRLVTTPGVCLPTSLKAEHFATRIQSVVTVATPHHGTPLASTLASVLGQKLLRALSLSTIYLLRYGNLPLSALLQMGQLFARLDNLGVNSALLDEVFAMLLGRFSSGRRRAVASLFGGVADDQALLVQVTPEGMDVFNASVANRPGVRYGSVITGAARPGLRSTIASGLDPSAQATHMIYGAVYRLAAQTPRARTPVLTAKPRRILRAAYGNVPDRTANDGIVPTRSQVWGTIIHAALADHLDVIGHFGDATTTPRHIDWLTSGSGFDSVKFDALWTAVGEFLFEPRRR